MVKENIMILLYVKRSLHNFTLLERIPSPPTSIQDAANLSELPQTVQAVSETGDALFL